MLCVQPYHRRLSLGIKQLQPDVWDTFFAQHRVGDVVKGKVLRTAQFGAFIELAEGVEGLCHVSEAVDDHGKQLTLNAGDEHELKIVKMSQEEKKVGLSIKAVGEEASRAEVESYKEQNRERGGGSCGALDRIAQCLAGDDQQGHRRQAKGRLAPVEGLQMVTTVPAPARRSLLFHHRSSSGSLYAGKRYPDPTSQARD